MNGSAVVPVWGSGVWIRPANVTQSTPTVLTATEQITFLPFVVGQFVTITKLGLYLYTAGSTGAQCDLGLYFSDPSQGVPSGLVFDCGALMLDGTGGAAGGIISVSVPTTANANLAPGIYWLACAMKGVGITTPASVARASGSNGQFIPPLANGLDLINNTYTRGYQVPASYKAVPNLPAAAPTVTPYCGNDIPVTLFMHA